MDKKTQNYYMISSAVIAMLAIVCMIVMYQLGVTNATYADALSNNDTNEATINEHKAEAKTESENDETKLNTDNDALYDLKKLRTQYECIVVLDGGHGGSDKGMTVDEMQEKDLTLAVAKKAGDLLEQDGIKVVYTHQMDETKDEAERVQIANEIMADYFISIHTSWDEDSSIYGLKAKYNDGFFIPGLSSVDLTYILLEKIAKSTNEKVNAIEPGTDLQVVMEAQVPVAMIEIGYLSNVQERKLLAREDYLQRISQGIYDGIIQAENEKKNGMKSVSNNSKKRDG